MASVTVKMVEAVNLTMTRNQAEFLYDLLCRRVAGKGFHETEYRDILSALDDAGIYCERKDTDETVVLYK